MTTAEPTAPAGPVAAAEQDFTLVHERDDVHYGHTGGTFIFSNQLDPGDVARLAARLAVRLHWHPFVSEIETDGTMVWYGLSARIRHPLPPAAVSRLNLRSEHDKRCTADHISSMRAALTVLACDILTHELGPFTFADRTVQRPVSTEEESG